MLKRFIWDTKYSVGVVQMDDQHKMFFSIANSIVDYINEKRSNKEDLLNLINRLVGYSFYHLNFEEYYFEKYKYDDRISHKDNHDAFRQKVQEYKDASSENEDADINKVASDLADFATQWLMQHILIVDAKYTEFFNNCPIEEHASFDFNTFN